MKTYHVGFILFFSLFFMVFESQAEPLFTVVKKVIPVSIQLDGIVQPVNQGTVAAQTSGRVVGMSVDVNDFVKMGSVLLEISATQQTAAYDEARAQLSQAIAQNRESQTQIKRYQRLVSRGAVSQGDFDAAEAKARSAAAAVKAAQAAVTKAKDALGYTSIRAPYDGVVTQRHVELGETVAPGTPLLSGYGLKPLRVEVNIPQKYRRDVANVSQFRVEAPTGTVIHPSKYSLFSYVDSQSHASTLRLRLSDSDSDTLTPGMWVKVRFDYGDRAVLVIPKQAVTYRGELSVVYRWGDGKRILNPIRVGQEDGSFIEVLSGLEAGDEIVMAPDHQEGK